MVPMRVHTNVSDLAWFSTDCVALWEKSRGSLRLAPQNEALATIIRIRHDPQIAFHVVVLILETS